MGKRDPNAPKRPLSAYFAWLGKNRTQVKADNPDMPHKEVTSKLGEMWNALDEEIKKSYKDTAQAEMNVWKSAFEEYKKTDNYKNWQAQKAIENANKKTKGKKKKPPKDADAPKRPSTGFFLFVQEKRAEVKASLPEGDRNKVTIVTKRCGELWKASSPEQQAKYKEQSKKLKEIYNEKLAAYKLTQKFRDHQEVVREFKLKQKNAAKRGSRQKRAPIRHLPSESSDDSTDSSES